MAAANPQHSHMRELGHSMKCPASDKKHFLLHQLCYLNSIIENRCWQHGTTGAAPRIRGVSASVYIALGPLCSMVGIVDWSGNGHRARAAGIRVTETIGELLKRVGFEIVVIPEHIVVGRAAGALDTKV